MNPLVVNVLSFLRGLRRLGLIIGTQEERLVLQALDAIGCEQRETWKNAIAAVVVKHPQDMPLFDAAWQQFLFQLNRPREPWLARNTLLVNVTQLRVDRHQHPEIIWMGRGKASEDDQEPLSETWQTAMFHSGASQREVLRQKEFGRLTLLEQQAMSRWRVVATPLWKKSHRMKSARRGARIDVAKTLRGGLRAGELLTLAKHARAVRERPVIFICDVSGSMDPYSRMFIRFGHALARVGIRVETFVFSTRLTRITNALRIRDADRALEEVSAYAQDFSSGTRLAEALATFNRQYARRLLHRGALVFLATDGFDTGSDTDLRAELGRLARLAHRVIWLNPLLGDPDFQPTARGIRTMSTLVDEVLPAHNWASLESAWLHVQETHDQPRVRRQDAE